MLKAGSVVFIGQTFILLDEKHWAIVDTESMKKLLKASATSFELFIGCPFILISRFFFLFVFWPVSFFSWFQIAVESPFAFSIMVKKKSALAFLMFLTTLFLNVVNKFLALADLDLIH